MSMEAELVTALGAVESKVASVATATERTGGRIDRALSRARDRVRDVGTSADRTAQSMGRMGRQLAGGLVGLGSLTALVAAGRRQWDEYQAGITRAADATAGFASRTRALGAPVGEARRAIKAAGVVLGPDEGTAVAEAFIQAGGAPTGKGIERAVTVANRAMLTGIDLTFAGQATALAEKAGITDTRQIEDLLASSVRLHGARAPQAMANMSRAQMRILSARSDGAMDERINSLGLEASDYQDFGRRMDKARTAFADINPRMLTRRSDIRDTLAGQLQASTSTQLTADMLPGEVRAASLDEISSQLASQRRTQRGGAGRLLGVQANDPLYTEALDSGEIGRLGGTSMETQLRILNEVLLRMWSQQQSDRGRQMAIIEVE
jgi:hypothetical protein